jgi:hypothetical protein
MFSRGVQEPHSSPISFGADLNQQLLASKSTLTILIPFRFIVVGHWTSEDRMNRGIDQAFSLYEALPRDHYHAALVRAPVLIQTLAIGADSCPFEICIDSMSPEGLCCRSEKALQEGDVVTVLLPEVDRRKALVVWQKSGDVGMKFTSPLDRETFADVYSDWMV